jgi:uncharacterized iron-regulated membrane protein
MGGGVMRKILFWVHLVVGLAAGSVVLVMSVTGLLLAYEKQMVRWVDREFRSVPAGKRLDVDALVPRVGKASSITLRASATAPVQVSYPGGRVVYLDAYSGAVLGEGSRGVRSFFRTVTELHRWLGADRSIGRPITRASSFAFLFLMISGLVLWWRGRVAKFRWRVRGRARDFNWHNVAGLWTVIPLLAIVFTAIVISTPRAPGGAQPQPSLEGAETIVVRLPSRAMTVDPMKPRASFRWWARYLHTGEAFGIVGQSVGAVACLAGAVLVWTGAALALRRMLGALRPRRIRARPTKEAEGVVALDHGAKAVGELEPRGVLGDDQWRADEV